MVASGPQTKDPQYVILSPELKEYLGSNNIRLEEILEKSGLNELSVVPDPTAPEGAREPVSILLGTAALVAASTPILTRFIERITNRPPVVKDYELAPVVDGKGNAVHKGNGDPILYWRERHTIVQSQDRGRTEQKLTAKIAGAIEIGFQYKSGP